MENVINALLNTLMVSIPEELVWFSLVLVFMKRFDLLDRYRWKENIKWFLIPVILTAISTNIFRYLLPVSQITMVIISLSIFIISIIYVLKHKNYIYEKYFYLKVIMFVFISLFIILLTENLYVLAILSILHTSINEINLNWIMNFLFSLPSRVLQILFIMYLLSRVENNLYLHITKDIFYDKKISIALGIFVFILILAWTTLIQIVSNYHVLQLFNIKEQLFIGVMVFLIPTILLASLIYIIISFVNKIIKIQKSHQNMLDDDYIN